MREIIFPSNVKAEISIPIPLGYIYLPCLVCGSFYLLTNTVNSINKMLLQKEVDIRIFPFIIFNGMVILNSCGIILSSIEKIDIKDIYPLKN